MFSGLKPYPEYKASGVPSIKRIPIDWGESRLRSVAQMRMSSIDKLSREDEIPVRLCNYVDVYKHEFIFDRPGYMSATASPAESAKFRLLVGDVLITKDSEVWKDIGVPALVVDEADDLVSGYHLALLRARKEVLSGEYLLRLLQTPAIAAQLHVSATGVTRFGLSQGDIKSVGLPVPSLVEQAEITRFVRHVNARIDRAIAAKRKLVALMEEQARNLVAGALSKGLDPDVKVRPTGLAVLSEVPSHWDIVALKRVLWKLIDCEHKTAPYDEFGSRYVVRTSAVRNRRIAWGGAYPTSVEGYLEWTRRGVPEAGDVIFTREAPVGEACVITAERRVCLGQRTVLMKVKLDEYDPSFLVLQIYFGPPRERLSMAVQGSTVAHLNMDDIGGMLVVKPPLCEQIRIVEFVDTETAPMRSAQDRADREISLLREFCTRLTADVVTGQLDVREAAAKLPVLDPTELPTDDVDSCDDLDAVAEEFLDEDEM